MPVRYVVQLISKETGARSEPMTLTLNALKTLLIEETKIPDDDVIIPIGTITDDEDLMISTSKMITVGDFKNLEERSSDEETQEEQIDLIEEGALDNG